MIKAISHLAAVVVMTLVVGIALTAVLITCLLLICFVAWVAPNPDWSALAHLFRLIVAFGLPIGIWFACAKEGREFASEFEQGLRKWLKLPD
jgi:uncharacterized membrane protein